MYMVVWNMSWVMTAHKLETEMINTRLNMFDKGKPIYLSNGLTLFVPNDENGNQKWNTRNEAINAAYSFLKTLN